MENKLTKLSVPELFQLFGERLFDLENPDRAVFPNQDFFDHNGDHNEDYDIKLIMDHIFKKVDNYEGSDVIARCKSYLKRIDSLKRTLNVPDYYYRKFYHSGIGEEITAKFLRSQEEIDILFRITQKQLDYCSKHLSNIVENHSVADTTVHKTVITEIKLPENFAVKQLSVHFEPLLSLRQAALFLYYLREKGVIPNYNASELGRLAEVFFARNNKNVREEITDIYENKQNSSDLKALHQILTSLLNEISTDLKKAT